jgi:peptide/nickel transport system permease protein
MSFVALPSGAQRASTGIRRVAGTLPISVLIAFAVVALVVAWALFPSLFTSQSPVLADPAAKFLGPSVHHWFGTDDLGRDEFARVV